MSSQTPDVYLDPDEYPEGSQKRQEKEAELTRLAANQPPPVPETEWRQNAPEGS